MSRALPGVKPIAGRLLRRLNPRGRGAWLFKQHRLGWMYEAPLHRQLPPFFRLLAAYCKLMGRLSAGDKVPLGDKAFYLASSLTRLSSSSGSLELVVDDLTVCLDLSDPRFLQVVNELRPDHPVGSRLASLLAAGDTFIDVGANHGSFSLVAAKAVGGGGRLVAVEPNPTLAALVSRTLELNAPCPFQVLDIACGDSEGEIDFFIPRSSSGAAGFFRAFSAAGPHRRIVVQQRRFDQALDWRSLPGRILLKLDVEGSEYAFLKGATEMIRSRAPILVLECNPASLNAAAVDPLDLMDLLRRLGYEHFSTLDEPSIRRPLADLEREKETNLLLQPAAAAPSPTPPHQDS